MLMVVSHDSCIDGSVVIVMMMMVVLLVIMVRLCMVKLIEVIESMKCTNMLPILQVYSMSQRAMVGRLLVYLRSL